MQSTGNGRPGGTPVNETRHGGVCAGLKVLDFSWGMAGPLAGMVLGDYGAEVVKIEPPGGDPYRRMAGAVQWHRGKKSIVLDLKDAAQQVEAQRLAAGADVLIESFRPGVADRLGIGYAALRQRSPGLVYCSISGFGQRGPWSKIKGYEGVVLARGGYMASMKTGWRQPGPIYLALKQASFGAANFALQGIFGALWLRQSTGQGCHVETSLLQGAIAFQINTTFRWADPSRVPPREAATDVHDPLCNVAGYRVCRCADGKWIQPGVFQSDIFHRMMVALGMDEESKDLRFVDAPRFKTDEDRRYIIRRMEEQFAKQPYAYWAQAFERYDVPYAPHLTTQEGMDDPQVRHLGLVAPVADPVAGATEQVGPLFALRDSGWSIHGPAPGVGQDTHEVMKEIGTRNEKNVAGGRSRGAKHLLEGVKVLEVATYVAAPTAIGYLVDYGASVIKVEPPGGDPQNNWGDVGTRPNRGKRSIWLNLKDPKDREVLYRLVRDSDIFLQNFRPGVAERLGIDFSTLINVNPRLVYCHATSYGSTGPYSKRGAFDPVITALTGGTVAQAGKGNPPVIHFTSDLGAGVSTTTALMMALYHRERTGRGQEVETRMLNAAAYLHADEFLRYPGKPPRRIADKGQHGLDALYRLYPAAEGWVFLAACTDVEWRAFCQATGNRRWLEDSRFSNRESRAASDEALAGQIAAMFKTRTAPEWERLLMAAGVACVAAHEEFPALVFAHEQMRETVGAITGFHPNYGEYAQVGPLMRLAGVPDVSRIRTSASGQDTADILSSLGYDPAAFPHLVKVKVAG